MASDALTIPKSAIRRTLAIVAIAVALVAAALIVWALIRSVSQTDSLASAINAKEYQSVALTSGDIYFGKLSAPGGDFYYLRHVYRLTSSTGKGGTKRTLTKLTSDINNPEDLLVINRRQILFVENLNPSGQASQIMSHAAP